MDEELLSHRHSNYAFIFLIAICVLLLTAHLSGYIRSLKDFLFYIVVPTPQYAMRFIQSGQKLSENLTQIVKIHQENIELKNRIEKYAYLENQFNQMRDENIRLRSVTSFSAPKDKRSIIAQVTLREPGSWFQWIIINRGAREGVMMDSPVIAIIDNTPAVLGRVAEVSESSSKVVLLTNVMSATPVMARSNEEDGLLEGQNSNTLKLNYLTKEAKIAAGDEIVTSPLSYVFPAGMLVGTVQTVVVSRDEAFSYAIVKPAVNLSSLREVVVMVYK